MGREWQRWWWYEAFRLGVGAGNVRRREGGGEGWIGMNSRNVQVSRVASSVMSSFRATLRATFRATLRATLSATLRAASTPNTRHTAF